MVSWDQVLKLDLHFFILASPVNNARDPQKKIQMHWKRINLLSKPTLRIKRAGLGWVKTGGFGLGQQILTHFTISMYYNIK